MLVVAVADDNTAFQPVKPESAKMGVEILEGLVVGDRVVTEGHQKLFPGATVATRLHRGPGARIDANRRGDIAAWPRSHRPAQRIGFRPHDL